MTMKKLRARATALALIAPAFQPLHRTTWVCKRSSHAYKNTSIFAPRFTFALRMTRASSQNVGKFTEQLSCPQRIFILFQNVLACMWYHFLYYLVAPDGENLHPGHVRCAQPSWNARSVLWFGLCHWSCCGHSL